MIEKKKLKDSIRPGVSDERQEAVCTDTSLSICAEAHPGHGLMMRSERQEEGMSGVRADPLHP
ncbi:MAG: hypothetical protein ACRCU9_12255 [Iodobacter sp.]